MPLARSVAVASEAVSSAPKPFSYKGKAIPALQFENRVSIWWQHLLNGFSRFQSGSQIDNCSQPVHARMPSSWRSVFVAVQHLATAIGNSIGPFRSCGLSSRLISFLEFYWVYWFYSCLLRRNQELAAGALLLFPELQGRFLTKLIYSQHCSSKTGFQIDDRIYWMVSAGFSPGAK